MIVLDTHVWLWWVSDPARLSADAQEAIVSTEIVGVSTLSAWEVAMLQVRGRISLDCDVGSWVRQAMALPGVSALAPQADVAVAAGLLDRESFPGDPLDRLIYATARGAGSLPVTRDRAIRAFDPRGTIW